MRRGVRIPASQRFVEVDDESGTEGRALTQNSSAAGGDFSDSEVARYGRRLPDDSEFVAHQLNSREGEITIVEDLSSDTILFYGSTSTTTSEAWRMSPRFSAGIMSISLSFEASSPPVTGRKRIARGKRRQAITAGDERDGRTNSGQLTTTRIPVDGADDLEYEEDEAEALAMELLPVVVDSPPCSEALVDHLIRIYFEEHFALLLNSMCAVVSQQCRDLTEWNITNPSDLHNAFFERARILLGRQFDWPHINNVQALILLCMVGQGTNINASSYHYIGIAHRQAVELGLHRDLENLQHPQLDIALRQTMQTTWFCLYILDRYTSVAEGRPMAICDEEWDTPFPSGDTPELLNLQHHVGLVEILGRIANYVNRPGRPTRPHWQRYKSVRPEPAPDPKQVVNEITADLAAWYSTLPPELARPPDAGPGVLWGFHHHLITMFHTATVLLHRLDVGRFDRTCHLNAQEISRILEALPDGRGAGSMPGGGEGDGAVPAGLHPHGAREVVFVIPLVVYAALTATTLCLDMVIASKHQREKQEQTEAGLGGVGGGGRTWNASQLMGGAELRGSLAAFERLKDTSLFASYYLQLAAEVLKSNGIAMDGITADDEVREVFPQDDEEEGLAASAGTGTAVPAAATQPPQQQHPGQHMAADN
ncbi:hypothetical protein HK405_012742, partial [Cladochytrium tenue]